MTGFCLRVRVRDGGWSGFIPSAGGVTPLPPYFYKALLINILDRIGLAKYSI
jgi:hypothetical protein